MKTIEVTLRGTAPLLMAQFNPQIIDGPQTRKVHVQPKSPEEEAAKLAYRTKDGFFYLPTSAIARLLRDAASNHKIRGSRRSAKYIIPAAVRVPGLEMILMNGDGKKSITHFAVDSRSVVVPATKGRVMRHRPMFPEWSMKFTLRVNETLLTTDFVKELLIEGGEQIGLGAFRIEKGGQFGAFEVAAWKEQPESKTA